MLYHLFEYLQGKGLDFPGIGLMHYLSFRAMLAAVISILIAFFAVMKLSIRSHSQRQSHKASGSEDAAGKSSS